MALEPITRKEKIIAGQDLTPITRLEKFLKNFGGGGGSVPKPLTYDYMPEGYPKKTVEAVPVMAEQEVQFTGDNGNPPYFGPPTEPFEIVVGQTYLVNWDGTDYECICVKFSNIPCLGNLSILSADNNDTGEPFIYTGGRFITLDTSERHTISVKTTEEIVTPMAEEFLPANTKNTTVFYI